MTSEENLTRIAAAAYGQLPKEERIKKIRELCRQGNNREFVKKSFPGFYKEAYPHE